MATDGKYSNGCDAHARNSGVEDELKKGSHAQQSARKGKERLLCPRGTETIKYPDKLKAENHLAPPLIRQQRTGLSINGKATADDELVKYMSNLPAYLQRIKKGDNFPEKVLNVGVLDWTRLEKWKLNQKAGVSVSSSSTITSKSLNVMSDSCSLRTALPIKRAAQRSGARGSSNSLSRSFDKDGHSGCLKPTNSKAMHTQDSVSGTKVYLDLDRKIISSSSSSGRNCAQVAVDERMKKQEFSQEIDLTAVKSSAPVKGATEPCKASIENSDQEWRNISETGAFSFCKLARCGEEVGSSDGETKELVEKAEESDSEVSHQPCHRKQKSIVLLLPKRFPQSSVPDMLKKKERRIPSAPCVTELHRNSISDSSSSGDLHSCVPFSEIPRSCPLPSRVGTQSKTVFSTPGQTSDAPSTSQSEIQGFPSFRCAKKRGSNIKAASLDLTAELKLENRENPEPNAPTSRNLSPNRRFSFSLGRMTRSLSFKETTSVPQLGPMHISAKSGPVTGHDSHSGDISNQERAKPATRGRSSPLQRFLDPLLKSKTMSSRYSAENIHPLKTVNPTGPLRHETYQNFTVQALLQLTVKDGNPLFKFVVDKNNEVLAAAISNPMSARRHDSSRSCTFYSVNEIKKKSIGWIGHGNKAKERGFACSSVGQMKLSHNSFSDWTSKRLAKQDITTECVLFSCDSTNVDKKPGDSIPCGELAAIVCRFSPNENSDHNSFTVILPGGVHGLPDKGEPSPLIDRWISGGRCDCGGWDVGCKLHVFSNNYCPKNTKELKTSSTLDRLELFAEKEIPSGRPVFSLTAFRKGIYSIEFDSSISLLQAFSICVAYLSHQGSLDTPEASCLSGENTLQEPSLSRNGTLKAPLIFQREGAVKYAPCPPLSPVGRV